MFERGMKMWREEKCEMMVAEGAGGFLGRKLDFDAKRLQNIRTPGLRSDGAVAMLGDRHFSRGADNRHGCRDVERVEPVAARAADVQDGALAGFSVERRHDGFCAKFARESGDFGGGLRFKGETA